MQVKITAIFCLIFFIVGFLIAGGIGYYIFSKASGKYKIDIAATNVIIKQLNTQITDANKIIDGLTNTNRDLKKTTSDEQQLVNRITELNRQALKGFDEGSIQK